MLLLLLLPLPRPLACGDIFPSFSGPSAAAAGRGGKVGLGERNIVLAQREKERALRRRGDPLYSFFPFFLFSSLLSISPLMSSLYVPLFSLSIPSLSNGKVVQGNLQQHHHLFTTATTGAIIIIGGRVERVGERKGKGKQCSIDCRPLSQASVATS